MCRSVANFPNCSAQFKSVTKSDTMPDLNSAAFLRRKRFGMEEIMNYGRNGVKQKKKLLNSEASRLGAKFGIASAKLLLTLAVTVMVIASCLLLGAAQGIIASAPDISVMDVAPDGYATKVYDSEGAEVQTLSATGSNRIPVTIDKVPKDLQHAFVAVEDARFYEHNGIDAKGILRAAVATVTKGRLSQGASTITQQLIKNNVFNAYNESTIEKIKRKLQEQYLAVKLETMMDKSEILENYLNTINLGNGYYGVQAAANGYFGKDVSELTLSECAVIASITQSPANLNPIKYPEDNKRRQTKVLKNILEQEYISQEQYDEAVADDVYARLQGLDVKVADSTYSYFVDTLIDVIINDLMEQRGYDETQATNMVYKSGLQIYSTQDSSMQSIADRIINDTSNYPASTEVSVSYSLTIKETDNTVSYYSHYAMLDWYQKEQNNPDFSLTFSSKDSALSYIEKFKNAKLANGGTVSSEKITYTVQPQVSFSVMDQYNGQVKVLVGGRGDKSGNRTLNRAVDSKRQPGSSIKPIGVYGPALDTGAITLASAIDDAPYYYSGENGKLVSNYTKGQYLGLVTPRVALIHSLNVPAVKTLTKITPLVGFNYLEKFGISTLVSPKEAINGHHDVVQALALGGLTVGVRNIEMAAAYATFANGGVYTKPIYYTKVLDHDGNVILDNSTPETHTVVKPTTAWLMTSALQSVASTGNAGKAQVANQPMAGKTGTTQNETDRWFCGYTPYYTAAMWVGYDDNSSGLSPSISQTTIWGKIMTEIHKDLPTKSFPEQSGIVELQVCSQSGKLPVEGLCDSDPRGSQIITEYFSIDNQPTEYCDTHVKVNICNVSGQVASSKCTDVTAKIFIKKAEPLYATSPDGSVVYKAEDEPYAIHEAELSTLCTVHSSGGGSHSGGSGSSGSSGSSGGGSGESQGSSETEGGSAGSGSGGNNNSGSSGGSNNSSSSGSSGSSDH